MVGTNEPIRRHRPRTVRSETFRRKALNLLNGISIGLRSGEYCGRYCTVAPTASITSFTPGTLWAGRLSITTMSLNLSIGARHCSQPSVVRNVATTSDMPAMRPYDRNLLPSIGPSMTHRGHHLVMSQGSDECDRLPCSLRNMADQSLATRATSPETDHIDAGRSLIDKHQSRRIKKALLPKPAPPRSRHVCSVLLGCPQAFF